MQTARELNIKVKAVISDSTGTSTIKLRKLIVPIEQRSEHVENSPIQERMDTSESGFTPVMVAGINICSCYAPPSVHLDEFKAFAASTRHQRTKFTSDCWRF